VWAGTARDEQGHVPVTATLIDELAEWARRSEHTLER
jgi:hypothetical protein